MPPRVFWEKSAEVIENKGRESEKERQESLRVRNRKEAKEIEEVREVEGGNPARFVRDNTRNGTKDSHVRQWQTCRLPVLSRLRRATDRESDPPFGRNRSAKGPGLPRCFRDVRRGHPPAEKGGYSLLSTLKQRGTCRSLLADWEG